MARPRRKRSREPRELRGLVDQVIAKRNLTRDVRETRVRLLWPDCVGETAAKRSSPRPAADGTLWIHVTNSSWMHQLSFQANHALGWVNDVLGPPPMTRVRFTERPRDPEDEADLHCWDRIRQRRTPTRRLPASLTADEQDAIRQDTAHVQDTELRDTIVATRLRIGV